MIIKLQKKQLEAKPVHVLLPESREEEEPGKVDKPGSSHIYLITASQLSLCNRITLETHETLGAIGDLN